MLIPQFFKKISGNFANFGLSNDNDIAKKQVQLLVDHARITQVISNLISNAVKYSHKEGNINIELAHKLMDNDSSEDKLINTTPYALQFSIEDNGIGIPENELANVFNKFIQSSKTKTNTGSSGLGLAICQEIINAHQGKIWAEHKVQGGSIFLFKLPLNTSSII